jgi:hypothetical protein
LVVAIILFLRHAFLLFPFVLGRFLLLAVISPLVKQWRITIVKNLFADGPHLEQVLDEAFGVVVLHSIRVSIGHFLLFL